MLIVILDMAGHVDSLKTCVLTSDIIFIRPNQWLILLS